MFSVRANRDRGGPVKPVYASHAVLLDLHEGEDWIGSTYYRNP